jgi:hypothetical protein
MKSHMRNSNQIRSFPAPRSQLLLRLPDGSPWRLSFSPGMERFIGHYPRLPGIETDGPVLAFETTSRQ